MNDKLLTIKDVAGMLQISVSRLHQWQADGIFPRSFKIGLRASRWRLETVEAWIESEMERSGVAVG